MAKKTPFESGIYKITNEVNGKFYIGSSQNLRRRWLEHKRNLNRNKNEPNMRFQNAWNKYGEGNFRFEVIEFVKDVNKLMDREQYYLDLLKPYRKEIGYNVSSYADRRLGVKPSAETRRKMSEAKKGMKFDVEWRANMSKAFKGRVYSAETRRRMSENHANFSGENNPMYGRRLCGKENGNAKKVICINTGEVFETMREAGRKFGINYPHMIGQVCKGKRGSCGTHPKTGEKLKWRYYQEASM